MYVERAPPEGEQALQRGPGHVHREWLSRGDTPKQEMKCVHKAKTLAAQRLEDSSRPCPYDCQEDVLFPSRDQGMYMDVLRPDDAPKGAVKYPKAFDRALMADDIPRATPTLAHAAVGSNMPVPFNRLHPEERVEVEGSRPKAHYPEVRKARDLSLNVRDIEGAQPKKMGHYVRHNRRGEENNPVQPYYATLQSENPAALAPSPAGKGRVCTLDASDVEGARPAPALPPRAVATDVMRCEPEFRSKARAAAMRVEAGLEPPPGPSLHSPQRPATPGRAICPRNTDPQDPTYSVVLPSGGGPETTSLACRFHEDSETPAMEYRPLGPVEGSQPRPRARNLTKPIFGLEVRDIEGAQAVRRVGAQPFSIYGPESNKEKSRSLVTADIPGAQVGTLNRHIYYKGPASARATAGGGAAIALAATSGGATGGGTDLLAERQRKGSLWLPASSAAAVAAERGDPPAAASTARQWAPPAAGRGRGDCLNDGGRPQANAVTIRPGALTAR